MSRSLQPGAAIAFHEEDDHVAAPKRREIGSGDVGRAEIRREAGFFSERGAEPFRVGDDLARQGRPGSESEKRETDRGAAAARRRRQLRNAPERPEKHGNDAGKGENGARDRGGGRQRAEGACAELPARTQEMQVEDRVEAPAERHDHAEIGEAPEGQRGEDADDEDAKGPRSARQQAEGENDGGQIGARGQEVSRREIFGARRQRQERHQEQERGGCAACR